METLLGATTYDDVSVYRTADEATDALAELGEAFVAAAPFPSQVGRAGDGLDDALTRVLEARYADPASTRDEAVDALVDALVDAGRVERHAGELVVPLAHSGPPARNWGPTLAVLRVVTEDLLARAETLARRSRAVDASDAQAACESLSRMLASLRDVLVRASSGAAFVGRRTDRRSARPLSFAEWAGGRLNGGDNA
ncbi:hypothetical protein SAMN05192554_10438 [Haloarchaeobius iranensis]|uniref:Uncharacterized protein n=2 Tax=Haloarchaeobius iranensis TaxID=996166 RepID=A0A1G9UB85_9EURY|nr:hypothetical protein SAMN05192554_10438 [Haloarchaeobius iranensis]